MPTREFIVTAVRDGPGRVTLGVYERHAIGEPGFIAQIALDDFEIERLHLVTGEALWDRVRGKR